MAHAGCLFFKELQVGRCEAAAANNRLLKGKRPEEINLDQVVFMTNHDAPKNVSVDVYSS